MLFGAEAVRLLVRNETCDRDPMCTLHCRLCARESLSALCLRSGIGVLLVLWVNFDLWPVTVVGFPQLLDSAGGMCLVFGCKIPSRKEFGEH
jgi:hypothetical protein